MCSIVLGEFIEGAEESSWGRGAGCVATGVDVRCRAYCLVSEVEGMLVVVVLRWRRRVDLELNLQVV